jgi:predicted RNA-binding Zn ribbon-like protein
MDAHTARTPHFIGNDLALDFINSAFGTGEDSYDCLADDASALAWLKAAGQLSADIDVAPAGLATLARSLRTAAGHLIEGTRSDHLGDAEVVNRILEAGRPRRTLELNADAKFTLTEQRRDDSPASLLEPIAAALARLLVEGDLTLVRQCEAHDCTLRFLDVTKSGRRRWCSMAVCGNRMKVAAFRSRKDAR